MIARYLTAPVLQGMALALAASVLGNIGLGLYAWGLRAEATLATERLADAPKVNAQQTQALNATLLALDACVGLDTFVERQWSDAMTAHAEAERKLSEAKALNHRKRETTYANDAQCRAWADMPVCDAIDDGLQ